MNRKVPQSIEWPKQGSYVLAVSGGVDSIVLLDLFASHGGANKYHLTVAHFDHKMRANSADDAHFVQEAAAKYHLDYKHGQASDPIFSEAEARSQRYNFLDSVAADIKADGIITAHHQDDLVETSILNLARGSGRIGLVPFSSQTPLRPLKYVSRAEIIEYATNENLEWREDITNLDISNPRNFVRHELFRKASADWTKNYIEAIQKLDDLNTQISMLVDSMLINSKNGVSISRADFMTLSLVECAELIMAAAKKLDPAVELDQRLVHELVLFGKTAKPGRKRPIRSTIVMNINRKTLDITA